MYDPGVIALILVSRPVTSVWTYWTLPGHIMQWHIPFDDWHCPGAENDLTEGGRFRFQMERKDGKAGFEHAGIYVTIVPFEMLVYTLHDRRKTVVEFQQIDDNTIVRERFVSEPGTIIEGQQAFYQSLLNRFKKYAEQQPEK